MRSCRKLTDVVLTVFVITVAKVAHHSVELVCAAGGQHNKHHVGLQLHIAQGASL